MAARCLALEPDAFSKLKPFSLSLHIDGHARRRRVIANDFFKTEKLATIVLMEADISITLDVLKQNSKIKRERIQLKLTFWFLRCCNSLGRFLDSRFSPWNLAYYQTRHLYFYFNKCRSWSCLLLGTAWVSICGGLPYCRRIEDFYAFLCCPISFPNSGRHRAFLPETSSSIAWAHLPIEPEGLGFLFRYTTIETFGL